MKKPLHDVELLRRLAVEELEVAAEKLTAFATAIDDAAQIFFAEVPTSNQVHHEIAAVARASLRAVQARKRPDVDCERVAVMVEQLSAQARKTLSKRGELPTPAALRDPAIQRDACSAVLRICRLGFSRQPGRKRKGGERSETMVSVLYAPKLDQWPLRHEPHHATLARLEEAYLDAKGDFPPTVNDSTPWAVFVQAFLDNIGAGDANAVNLINEHHRRRGRKQLGPLVIRLDRIREAITRRLQALYERLSGQN
jgi:hypothetical protein